MGTNGVWIQSAPEDEDNDPATSEGLFLFIGQRPTNYAPGQRVLFAEGTVTEFRPAADLNSPTLTELTDVTLATLNTSLPLPAPIALTSGVDWERYEGMRVSVPELRTVSGTLGSINEATAISTSTGIFFGVLPGAPSPYRAPNPNETFDLLRIDTMAQGGTPLDVAANAKVSNLIGPLDYAFRTYTVVQDPTPVLSEGGLTPTPIQPPPTGAFTIANANVRRLFDEQDDPSTSDPVVTTAAVQSRLTNISRVFRETLLSPDIIAVEEVENESLLRRLAQATGDYEAYLFEGNDIGGIDVGLLIKRSSRTRVISVTQEGKNTMFAGDLLWDRPPLIARLDIGGIAFTAIVVHLRSLINADTATVAAKRRAQAEALRDIITARAQSGEEVLVLGDFNMYQFDALMTNIIRGGEPLTNLIDTLPLSDNYSYIQDGVSQTLDHMLVTEGLKARLYQFEVAHINAAFPDTERISDHDIPVGTFLLDPASVQIKPAGVTNAANFLSTPLTPNLIATAFGRDLSNGIVRISNEPAAIIARSATQVSFLVPSNLAGPTATLQIGSSNTVSVPTAAAAPGIFAFSPTTGIVPGSSLVIYATGAVQPTTVRIGGQPAQVTSELLNGIPGSTQITVTVPQSLAPGNAPVILSNGARTGDYNTFITIR